MEICSVKSWLIMLTSQIIQRQKCIKAAKEHLAEGTSVAVGKSNHSDHFPFYHQWNYDNTDERHVNPQTTRTQTPRPEHTGLKSQRNTKFQSDASTSPHRQHYADTTMPSAPQTLVW